MFVYARLCSFMFVYFVYSFVDFFLLFVLHNTGHKIGFYHQYSGKSTLGYGAPDPWAPLFKCMKDVFTQMVNSGDCARTLHFDNLSKQYAFLHHTPP